MNDNFSSMSSEIGNANNYASWIVEVFRPHMGGRILEVGVGYGNYKALLPASKKHMFVDIDASAIDNAKSKYPDENFLHGNIAEPETVAKLQSEQFDTVICFNVLEHIEDDSQAIGNMLSILQPGGKLLLFVPAFPALYSEMDRFAGHFRRYTSSSLRQAVAVWSGDIVEMSYFNPIGGLGWWLNKFVSHKSLDDASVNRQIILFDKYVLPFSRILNRVTKSLFGQSLVCVIQKLK
jgi:SAM-dependent methyltransferase